MATTTATAKATRSVSTSNNTCASFGKCPSRKLGYFLSCCKCCFSHHAMCSYPNTSEGSTYNVPSTKTAKAGIVAKATSAKTRASLLKISTPPSRALPSALLGGRIAKTAPLIKNSSKIKTTPIRVLSNSTVVAVIDTPTIFSAVVQETVTSTSLARGPETMTTWLHPTLAVNQELMNRIDVCISNGTVFITEDFPTDSITNTYVQDKDSYNYANMTPTNMTKTCTRNSKKKKKNKL